MKKSYFSRSKSTSNIKDLIPHLIPHFSSTDDIDDIKDVKDMKNPEPIKNNNIELDPEVIMKILKLIPKDDLKTLFANDEDIDKLKTKLPDNYESILFPKPVISATHLTTTNVTKYALSRDNPKPKKPVVVVFAPTKTYSTKTVPRRRG